MMTLRFRLRCIVFSVLFLLAIVPVQVVTPTAHAKDKASHTTCVPTCDTECSKYATEWMTDIKALRCVLATIATKLDEREEKLTQKAAALGIPAKIDRRAPIEFTEKDLCSVQNELARLGLGQHRDCGRAIVNLDHFLIRSHAKYKELKKCDLKKRKPKKCDKSKKCDSKKCKPKKCDLKKCKSYAPYFKDRKECKEYSRYIDDIDQIVHALLERRGLHRTMSAVLRGGLSLVDVAPDGKMGSGESPTALPKWVNILWGTKHWRDEESWVDYSLTGQVGVVPILALYSSATDNQTTKDKTPDDKTSGTSSQRSARRKHKPEFALHESGLIYDAQLNANINKWGDSELSAFIGGGQTRLWDKDANAGTVQSPNSVRLVENGPGLSAYRYGWGVEFRLYSQDLDIVHHDKSLLSPVFKFEFGMRCDERFKSWNAHCSWPCGQHARTTARIGIDLRQVFDQRKVEEKNKSHNFGIRLVADREWGAKAPTSNRLFVEADVNMSKLLFGNWTSD